MIKLIHVGDNHIGAALKSSTYASDFALRRQREIINSLFRVVDYANKKDVDYILVAGDVFDSESMRISDVKDVFKKFGEFNGQILLIAGNHDPLTEDSFWNTIKYNNNIHIFGSSLDKIAFPKDNLVVYGHSWDKYYIEEQLLNNIKDIDNSKINVLIAHGDIYNKKSQYLPIDKDHLINLKFDYVALGHIHKHDFITSRIAYSGSLEPLDFSETGKHGFIYIELNKKTIKTEFIPFAERNFVVETITVNSQMTDNDIYRLVNNIDTTTNKNKNLYRIIFEGRYNYELNLKTDDLNNIFKNDFAYIEFINNAKMDFDINQLKKDNQNNIIALFINKFEKLNMDDDVIKDAFNIGLELLLNSKEGLL